MKNLVKHCFSVLYSVQRVLKNLKYNSLCGIAFT